MINFFLAYLRFLLQKSNLLTRLSSYKLILVNAHLTSFYSFDDSLKNFDSLSDSSKANLTHQVNP